MHTCMSVAERAWGGLLRHCCCPVVRPPILLHANLPSDGCRVPFRLHRPGSSRKSNVIDEKGLA